MAFKVGCYIMKIYDYRNLPSRQKLPDDTILCKDGSGKDKLEFIARNGNVGEKCREFVDDGVSGTNFDRYNKAGYFKAISLFDNENKFVYVDLLGYIHESEETIDKSLIDFYMGKKTFDQLNDQLFKDEQKKIALVEFAIELINEALKEEAKNKKINKMFLKAKLKKAINYINDVCEEKANTEK